MTTQTAPEILTDAPPETSDVQPASANTLLTPGETSEFAICEDLIQKGLETFVAVGTALITIRERRLYRVRFSTFEAYCAERWGFRARYAQRIMAAAQISKTLANPPGDAANWPHYQPAAESHIRPLVALPPEEQRAAWAEAVFTAPGGVITARHVQAVVDKRLGKTAAPAASGTQTGVVPDGTFKFVPANNNTIDLLPFGTREEQLREAAARAIADVRALLDKMGTINSGAGANVTVALEHLETFQQDLERLEQLHAARPQ